MHGMKNLYEDRLETFSFAEMLDSLAGIGVETGRLETKQEMIPNHKLAYIACSMANADGGIIAIGIDDPDAASEIRVHGKLDISDRARVAAAAAINARVYPPMPLEVHGYRSTDGSSSFLTIRVGRSSIAPHEYTGTDETHNLPIRRGSHTDHLRLSEIDALRERRPDAADLSPMEASRLFKVSLQRTQVNPEFIFGMEIMPTFFRQTRRIMDVDDDQLCVQVEEATRGLMGDLHDALTADLLLDGVWLHNAIPSFQPGSGQPSQPRQQVEIDSDGVVIVRFVQTETDLWKQYMTVLVTGYIAAQEIYYAFGINPVAEVYLTTNLGAAARESRFPQGYDDRFTIDLATQPFADAFLATTMRMLRASNQNSQRDAIRNEVLQAFVTEFIPVADELQARWLSS